MKFLFLSFLFEISFNFFDNVHKGNLEYFYSVVKYKILNQFYMNYFLSKIKFD